MTAASPPRTGAIGVALFAVALLLRLPGLDSGLWFDEVWMLVDFVRAPLGTIVASYPTDNHHPICIVRSAGRYSSLRSDLASLGARTSHAQCQRSRGSTDPRCAAAAKSRMARASRA